MSRVEHVVVGGGVIGLSLAYELRRRGRGVLVLERDMPGAGASSIAAGMLAPVSEADVEPPELIDLGLDSLRRYPDFVRGIEELTGESCHYRDEGTLWVALDRDDRAELDHLARLLADKGLEATAVSADEIRRLEPHLSPRAIGGLRVPGDHQLDPRSLLRCLALALDKLGGDICTGVAVESIEVHPQGELVVEGRRTSGEPFEVRAERVVVAAGAWCTSSIRLPIDDFGLRPVKGQVVRMCGPCLVNHVVRGPDVYLVPRSNGELLVGATMEEMGFEDAPTAGAVMDLLRHAWELVPAVYDLELSGVEVGLRPAVSDNLPVIGATEAEGLFLAAGHFRNGILLAPTTASLLADWLHSGTVPPGLLPFLPSRLAGTGASTRT